ncbi:MAG: glyoxalase/bleomycin resistance/extradiol dioxygenase family protein [Candidatus Aenigmarchaeota archaeon]|nr:glyoxalase/bleomycin resistance/extradiol dioxygenase family protein [Candidatus Aenigmarchaeota archaeon]
MATKIFINLPVKELKRSMDFFTKLGFSFNPRFTDQNAACLVISDSIYAMLVMEKFFLTFTKKQVCNTATHAETINAIAVGSRQQVDTIMQAALKAGAIEHRPAQDYGWMYGRSFQDLDGHLWEVFHMDESKAGQAAASAPGHASV